MKTATILIVALLIVGCSNFYEIHPNAIIQYNGPFNTPITDAPFEDGTRAMAMAPDSGNEPGTSQDGQGNRQNTVYIGGRNAPASDLDAALDITATIRDLIVSPGAP